MDYTLISSKDLISDYTRRYQAEGDPIDEGFIRSIIDDTVPKMVGKQLKKFSLALLDVKDNRTQLPKNYSHFLQAAYKTVDQIIPKEEVSQFVQGLPGNLCNLEINVKCPACKQDHCNCGKILYEVDVDKIWRMSNPEYTAAASKFFSDYYNPTRYRGYNYPSSFTLMDRSNDTWFGLNDLTCKKDHAETIEYKIYNGTMTTNFREGEVLLAYMAHDMDKDGYRLVPNVPRVIDAVLTAVIHAVMERRYYITLDRNVLQALDRLDRDKEVKITRARAEIAYPEYDEFVSILKTDWRKMFNPNYWHNAGKATPDKYNPGNNYSPESSY